MNHLAIARALLSLLCVLQGLATPAIDLNHTHATNPAWPGHARFHVVWQTMSVALLSVLELALIWWHGPYAEQRFYLVLLLASISPLGFLIAFLCRRSFGATLSDANGMPQARLAIFGTILSVDLNIVAIVTALLSLAVILAIYTR